MIAVSSPSHDDLYTRDGLLATLKYCERTLPRTAPVDHRLRLKALRELVEEHVPPDSAAGAALVAEA